MLVANGAQLVCTMGTLPSTLTVLPDPRHNAASPPPQTLLATVTDVLPGTNIQSFTMCNSTFNPAVQAATAAKAGAFTPAPCVPATELPWAPAATVLVSGVAAFDQKATCQCQWQGTVKVLNPGQAVAVVGP